MSPSESGTGRRTKPADLRRTVRLFRTYAGPRGPYWVGCALLVVEAVTAVVEPIPIAYLVDFLQGARPSLRDALGTPVLLPNEQYETILLLTVAIVLLAAVNSAADSLTEVAMARGGRSLGYSIRVAMYSHLQRLPLGYHDTKRTGDVLTRVTGDVLVVEDFVVKSVSNILGSLLVLVGSFLFLLTQSWNVALVAIVVIPLLALISNHYSRRIKVASRTQRDREGELASTAQEMLTSIRLVQSYGRGTVDLERFSGQTAKSMRASLAAANIQAQFSWVIALVEALSISAVVWLGVWLLDQEVITIGTLVLFVLLLQNMFKPSRKIVSEWYKIGKVFASVERIEDLLDREIAVSDHPDARPAPDLQGRLTFRHVGFTYPAEHEEGGASSPRPAVLTDIDFDLAPGEVVALVGHSGAGKSTVAQLVPRLYDADVGDVLVDGLPVRDLTLASLRAQVSLVLQDTVLLSGSVAENIGYGIADATQADIEDAARLANAHDFIVGLPDGYATTLGERGATLSGGQRQRLAIARAFIRRAPILILDEPTTGLDAESSRSVIDALRCLMQGKTTILISHDLALVHAADRVLVIAGGRITETGSPEQLVREDGPYADLFGPQARRPAADPGGRPGTWLPTGLAGGLGRLLPGMTRALDPEFATGQVRALLRDQDAVVDGATAGQLWLRDDGTCSLRYSVRLDDGSGPVDVEPLLGRLHPDDATAAAYVRHLERLLPGRTHVDRRWRTPVSLVPDVGLALHPFPLDPDLPTLPACLDPSTVRGLLTQRDDSRHPEVEVVHHPRQGPCVLRYRFGGADRPSDTYYGKVFPDGTGAAVGGYLRDLGLTNGGTVGEVARLPRAAAYSPSLRLLCTEALPGTPLRRLLGVAPDAGAEDPEQAAALVEAMLTAGRALSALHRTEAPDAPAHSAADELADLRDELALVATVWPTEAERIRRPVEQLGARVPAPADQVLSHGDFTPSQLLLDGDRPGIVDLDTLCVAEPALDLGRFLAHVRLLVAKLTGRPDVPLAVDLSHAFLRGYCGEDGRTVAGDDGNRVAFYVGTTLARSAVHACRQLKDERLEIALELLHQVPLSEEVEL